MTDQELRAAIKDFLERLINQGFGKTMDNALPGEFDTLWNEVKND